MSQLQHIPAVGEIGAPYADDRSLIDAINPHDLVYFVLNVGNADTQLLLLPEADGVRHMVIVDIGTVHKSTLPKLITALLEFGTLSAASRVKLLIATHPHADHVGGIPNFLEQQGHLLEGGEIWDPGFYHTTGAWHEMMRWVQEHPEVARLHPTAGTRRHIGVVAITALSPAIRLRNNFDTYGVKINNASIATLIEFPIKRVFRGTQATFAAGRQDRAITRQTLLLGADAQTNSWSHVDVDFPTLVRDHSPEQRLLGLARGKEPLRANVFKVPHHSSKHGLNLELVERIKPDVSIISCKQGTTGHAFPHEVALNQLREAKHSVATSGADHHPDWDPAMKILTTDDRFEDDTPLGSIAMVIPPSGRNRRIFRHKDSHNEPIDPTSLVAAHEFIQ